MDLNQLRYFQKVARTQSVTRAAQELYVSQPTLSQSLSRLESSLGVPLFVHQAGKPLQLNEAGRAFLQRVDAAFTNLEEGVNVVREMNLKSVQVSIASAIHNLCDELVVGYYKLHPEASISQRLAEINSLTALLLNDEVDFTISPCPLPDPRLECIPLFTEEFMVAVGPGHRLYGVESVPLKDLRCERFICNYTETDRNLLERIFGENSNLDIMLESDESTVVRRVINSGSVWRFARFGWLCISIQRSIGGIVGLYGLRLLYRFPQRVLLRKKEGICCKRPMISFTIQFHIVKRRISRRRIS